METRNQHPTGSVANVLSALFKNIRDLVTARSIGGDRGSSYAFGKLLNDYISDPRNGVPDNRNARSSTRNNLAKELEKSTMSWKLFCKGMRVLNFVKFKITITTYSQNGQVSEFSQMIQIAGVSEETEDSAKDSGE